MDKIYKIKLSKNATYDIRELVDYIKNKLKEPNIAEQHREIIKEKILSLKQYPSIYNVMDKEQVGIENLRKINVKNFMIFYQVFENDGIVRIIRVIYGKSNWKKELNETNEQ